VSLHFKRLNMKSMKNEKNEEFDDHALFNGQFKGKCRNCGLIGHMSFQCNGGNNGNMTEGNYCSYCHKLGQVKQNCFKLKKKETQYGHNEAGNNNNGNHDRENYDSQDVVFAATFKNESFTEDIWICHIGACGHYCNSSKSLFNVEEIKENITVGNGKSMIATKIGSLKFWVIQLDGSGLDINLYEVYFVAIFFKTSILPSGYRLFPALKAVLFDFNEFHNILRH
jgi:hypothetical protein